MEEFIDYLKLRSLLYQVLSYGFYMEPDAAYLADLKKSIPIFESIHNGYPNPSLKEGIRLLREFVDKAEADSERTLSDYKRHFALVFLSPGFSEGRKSVAPYESVYLSAKGWVMQEQRDEVLECYYREGIGKEADFKEPEDHISAEMNFVSLLGRQAVDSLISHDENTAMSKLEAQLDFLNSHLLKWVEKVCDDLFTISDFILYRALAKLTAGFIRTDHQFLSELLDKDFCQ